MSFCLHSDRRMAKRHSLGQSVLDTGTNSGPLGIGNGWNGNKSACMLDIPCITMKNELAWGKSEVVRPLPSGCEIHLQLGEHYVGTLAVHAFPPRTHQRIPAKRHPTHQASTSCPATRQVQRQTRLKPNLEACHQAHSETKMSRAGSSAARNLTLTEELERLEQSITLTLQGR